MYSSTRPSVATLLVLTIATLAHQVLGQHYVQQTVTTNQQHESPNLKQVFINEDLFQQFKQWQHEQQSVNHLTKNSYYGNEGNPWLHTTQPPPSTSYVDPNPNPNPNPGNYWTGNQQQGGYNPPTTIAPGYPPPGGYYPPVTGAPVPPPYGGWVPPPDTPEVAALRKYCLKPRGQFPSKSCNKYVNCWDDSIIEQECPAGLLFSDKGYCDYDYNVDCKGRNVNPATPPPTMPPTDGKCPTLFGNYRSKTNCSEFFVCNHGTPVKFCCPAGLYYSTELGVCDYPYNVDCINPRPLHPGNVGPSHSQEIPAPVWINNYPYNDIPRVHADLVDQGKQCIPNTVYRLTEDCSTVAICRSNGRSEVVKCGFQTAFDAERGICVAKHLALC